MLNRIKELYDNGENVIQYLKSLDSSEKNNLEDILISYDIQAGIYTSRADINRNVRNVYCENLANVLSELEPFDSLLEIGVGEASTLGNLLPKLKNTPKSIFGFDISWSRIKYANEFLKSLNLKNLESIRLSTGDLFNSPFADNSIDVVYTSHSIEPNGGKETEALKALYRISKKYIVLLEPDYGLANDEAKARMKKNGYVTNLYETAIKLGYNVLKHELFVPTFNPLNPTSLIVIKKHENEEFISSEFACPITHSLLEKKKSAYYAKDALLAYPILDGVPCLLPENAIIASHFLD
jgi:ubiquinone/menaquinone biosynthesis C-methylase UbiE/uncharacterized protein YbaR (Trm112 family)